VGGRRAALARTPARDRRLLDDYVVACDARGRVLACAAVREYSPSLAEVVSVAVARAAHGCGLGRRVVRAAEALARVRGHTAVFAHTLQPEFFEALGYDAVERARYPGEAGREHTQCFRRASWGGRVRAARAGPRRPDGGRLRSALRGAGVTAASRHVMLDDCRRRAVS
jgi:N-acetylglutamate synthase-like GNAT family acetyltransferase